MWIGRLALCSAILAGLFLTAPAQADDYDGAPGSLVSEDIADLKTQLNSGLKCRRPVEFEFVTLIVQMVDNGTLSEELVKGTFQWARRKKPYPFPYFERGIRERAAAAGVTIP